jgi:hypothetical protein
MTYKEKMTLVRRKWIEEGKPKLNKAFKLRFAKIFGVDAEHISTLDPLMQTAVNEDHVFDLITRVMQKYEEGTLKGMKKCKPGSVTKVPTQTLFIHLAGLQSTDKFTLLSQLVNSEISTKEMQAQARVFYFLF